MTQRPYDVTSPASIRDHAKKLIGKSLEEVVGKYDLDDASNKGKLGTLVEEHHYEYRPDNNSHGPDFAEAGVELKVTGVVPKSGGGVPFKAKERLVLMMIHYYGLADEVWEQSGFLKKCRLMLILFYLYEKGIPATQRKFVMSPVLWEFSDADLEIIKKDWMTIQQKILDGLAHELSEGDTFYLAACRKGSGGPNEALKRQPFSEIGAKARAFSLKPSYVNTIIDSTWRDEELIRSDDEAEEGIEVVALKKFAGLEGQTEQEIAARYDYPIPTPRPKGYLAGLSLRILGTKKKWLPEFVKAGVQVKTIRLNSNGTPEEAMSFPGFNFIETANQAWEDSVFYEKINQKFFFVVFQYDNNGVLRFKKCLFWNMPYVDRQEAERVWQRTVDVINAGGNLKDRLPRSSESPVAHVRPKGRNNLDILPLPDGGSFPKQCFWLNAQYIKKQVSEDYR